MSNKFLKRMLGKKPKVQPLKPRDKETLQMEYARLCSYVGDLHFKREQMNQDIQGHFAEMKRITQETYELYKIAEAQTQKGPTTAQGVKDAATPA